MCIHTCTFTCRSEFVEICVNFFNSHRQKIHTHACTDKIFSFIFIVVIILKVCADIFLTTEMHIARKNNKILKSECFQ